MTQLLEQALARVQGLPQPEQDAIVSLILDELADEQRWADSFARSQDQLTKLAEKVREDVWAGRVRLSCKLESVEILSKSSSKVISVAPWRRM